METNLTLKHLKALNKRIKTGDSREAFQELMEIDLCGLTNQCKIYVSYLKGKYFMLSWKKSKGAELSFLLAANTHYDEMIHLGMELGEKLPSPKYFFVRAHVKYLLSTVHDSTKARSYFKMKALHLARMGHQFNPTNSSFIWLKKQCENEE